MFYQITIENGEPVMTQEFTTHCTRSIMQLYTKPLWQELDLSDKVFTAEEAYMFLRQQNISPNNCSGFLMKTWLKAVENNDDCADYNSVFEHLHELSQKENQVDDIEQQKTL